MTRCLRNIGPRTGLALAALFAFQGSALGQAVDQPRLSLGLNIGEVTSSEAWDVSGQPLVSYRLNPGTEHNYPSSIADVRRDMASGLTVGAKATWYPGMHWGLFGELQYVGTHPHDTCKLTTNGGDSTLATACAQINENDASASAVVIMRGGVIGRLAPSSLLQPYVRIGTGLALTPSSTMEVRRAFPGSDVFVLYPDDHWSQVRPTWSFGAGIATAPTAGFQVYGEFQVNELQQTLVTGAALQQGVAPPHASRWTAFPTFLAGFDLLLRRSRGKRY